MRIVSITDTKEEMEFAHCAAEHMAENPRLYTFANGDPQPGKLFAIRWNPFTVLVVKLDEMHEPACYPVGSFIGKDLPPLKGDVCIGDSVAGRAAAEGSADETGESKIGAGSATGKLMDTPTQTPESPEPPQACSMQRAGSPAWSPMLRTSDLQFSLYADDTFEIRDGGAVYVHLTAEETSAMLAWLDARERENDVSATQST